jgi:hypothetical protein
VGGTLTSGLGLGGLASRDGSDEATPDEEAVWFEEVGSKSGWCDVLSGETPAESPNDVSITEGEYGLQDCKYLAFLNPLPPVGSWQTVRKETFADCKRNSEPALRQPTNTKTRIVSRHGDSPEAIAYVGRRLHTQLFPFQVTIESVEKEAVVRD